MSGHTHDDLASSKRALYRKLGICVSPLSSGSSVLLTNFFFNSLFRFPFCCQQSGGSKRLFQHRSEIASVYHTISWLTNLISHETVEPTHSSVDRELFPTYSMVFIRPPTICPSFPPEASSGWPSLPIIPCLALYSSLFVFSKKMGEAFSLSGFPLFFQACYRLYLQQTSLLLTSALELLHQQ